ncbi:negative regulator of flagellin synthesis FlgM [Thermodesulfovibrio aggregans]|uniref:Negative regulator of flagellin synthesis n=1 Tax=Thermodesulfovibrio aggregans TaxID=86166 RepID=A0A0U9HX22_9BACT|nr:flagellar biosynthesis anti-sigma factor FlgM [Thermodesulfovibrio aggregans]GAQ94245.1 negative regulator of flagellin synthesis FlgM [Thermodesulfovibrio aggregans]
MIGGPIRIDGIAPNTQIAPEKSQGKAPERSEEVLTKDQVTVSEAAKNIARLMVEVSNIPDIRADKVEELKNAINSGTYEVRGSEIAGKIIKEALIDRLA